MTNNKGQMTNNIWKNELSLKELNEQSENALAGHLGIEITEVGDDYVKGKMPVDNRTIQPFGLLHGGASVVLAETLGSIGGGLSLKWPETVVGLDINANHIRAVRSGYVTGIAKPVHLGGKTQVWEIKIYNEDKKMVCISRLTLAIIKIKEEK